MERWSVKVENIPEYIRTHAQDDVIVEFDDGDRHPAAALDLQGANEDGEFEIYAAFQGCLGKSHAYAQALEAGSPERFPGSWWSSDKPRKPVGVQYTLVRISSVYDNDSGYYVYEKESAA